MAKDDSYEIMPYKEIVDLKKQIVELQGRGDTSSKELLQSMAALTKSMNNMLQLFSSAAEEMKLEEKTEDELSKRIEPLFDKVNKLEDQNRTIAEGLVAIASMVKDIRKGKMERPPEIHKPAPPPPPKPPEKSPFENLPPLGEEPEEPELPSLEPPEPKPMPPPGGPMGPPPRGPIGPPPGMGPPLGGPMPPPPGMGPPLGGPMPPPGMGPPPGGLGPLPPLPPLGEEPKKKKGVFGLFKKK